MQLVVYTCGSAGAYAYTRTAQGFAAVKPVKAVDTTGAGDGFIGSFLWQLCRDGVTVDSLPSAAPAQLEQWLAFSNRYCGESVQRYFFDYPQPVAGEGHFISTYKHNGSPIPSFEGEPLRFACPRTIGDFAHGLWQNLNPDNKVSLFARVIDLDSGETGDMIFNKYDAVNSDLDDPEEPELLPEELELLAKLDAEAE